MFEAINDLLSLVPYQQRGEKEEEDDDGDEEKEETKKKDVTEEDQHDHGENFAYDPPRSEILSTAAAFVALVAENVDNSNKRRLHETRRGRLLLNHSIIVEDIWLSTSLHLPMVCSQEGTNTMMLGGIPWSVLHKKLHSHCKGKFFCIRSFDGYTTTNIDCR